MSTLFTRRKVLTGMGLLGLGSLLGGCDYSPKLNFKYGKDLSDKIMGRTFKLKNTDGETVTLSSYRGLMPVVFFGFTLGILELEGAAHDLVAQVLAVLEIQLGAVVTTGQQAQAQQAHTGQDHAAGE